MPSTNAVVFRTHAGEHDWIVGELKRGRLRQGWGPPGSSLMEENRPLSQEEWVDRFHKAAKESWNSSPSDFDAEGRYRVLSRMLDLAQGDLVVVPKMPDAHHFTIARVADGYGFDDSHCQQVRSDLCHIVYVDPQQTVRYHNDSPTGARTLSSKLAKYRSAVTRVTNPEMLTLIDELYPAGS